MRLKTRTYLVLVVLSVSSACGEPALLESPNDSVGSTSTLATPTTTSTQPPEPTTTSTLESSTTTASPVAIDRSSTCALDPTLDDSAGPPAVTLLLPRPSTVGAGDKYYSWPTAIGTDSFTMIFTAIRAGDDSLTTRIEARRDGPNHHYLVSEFGGETDELILVDDAIWANEEDRGWTQLEEIGHLARTVLAPVSAELWYSVAHASFEATEFTGWAELDGEKVAVFEGDTAAAQNAAVALGISEPAPEGAVMLGWDPAGFFRSVAVTFANEFGSATSCWTVTDLDETTVSPPD